jgi:hypothetical protein
LAASSRLRAARGHSVGRKTLKKSDKPKSLEGKKDGRTTISAAEAQRRDLVGCSRWSACSRPSAPRRPSAIIQLHAFGDLLPISQRIAKLT